jgi:hypothetical protein
MSFSIRYIDPDSADIVERFLTSIVAPNLTAEHLYQYIIDTLTHYHFDLSSVVSQGYDGAAVLSGSVSGIQACIREIVPHAIYVHCQAHCLNLVLVDCVKSISHASEFFSLIQSLLRHPARLIQYSFRNRENYILVNNHENCKSCQTQDGLADILPLTLSLPP